MYVEEFLETAVPEVNQILTNNVNVQRARKKITARQIRTVTCM
jgi:hypothetical protein